MTIQEFIDMTELSSNLFELDLKIKIGNKYVDTESVEVKDGAIIIYLES
jgi:hypothetical protein